MAYEDDEIKQICFDCTGEAFLSQLIKREGETKQCTYCEETQACISLDDLADRVEVAFEHHYVRTSDQPEGWELSLQMDRESDYEWEREGQPVLEAIEEAAVIPTSAAKDVLELLEDRHSPRHHDAIGEESEFDSDSYYEPVGASASGLHMQWSDFEQSLKKEARFFSRTASGLLAEVFGKVDELKTKPGRPLVVNAGPGRRLEHLYRARVFQSEPSLKAAMARPDLHLSPPPAQLATAGRMNDRGISVFYGATNASVALAEVRPPVGSQVVVAKFTIIRELRLLDLTALDGVRDGGSIFDPQLKHRLERIAFLRSLGQLMTRPVMPDDQDLDYLPTQAIADFLATENEPMVDGIVFRSAQSRNGRNVVLFRKASRVEAMALPEGTEITAYTGQVTEDGWEDDYWVSEAVPRVAKASSSLNQDDPFAQTWQPPFMEGLNGNFGPSLRVDPESLEVHQVDWVKVHSSKHRVRRSRHEAFDVKLGSEF